MAAPMSQQIFTLCHECLRVRQISWDVRNVYFYILLAIFIFAASINVVVSSDEKDGNDEFEDYLLCRQCGHEVAKATDLMSFASTQALNQRNDTILGVDNVLIQLFKNPQGRHFEVITTQKADVKKLDTAYSTDTWFPNLSWRIISCPHCRAHLGWSYEPHDHKAGKQDTAETFYGLILNALIHQGYADSLLVMPKLYGS